MEYSINQLARLAGVTTRTLRYYDETISSAKGEIKMTDNEKFEGFKKQMISKNEEKFGNEIRAKYGEDTVKESNRKLMGMSREAFDKTQKISEELASVIKSAVTEGDPGAQSSYLTLYAGTPGEETAGFLAGLFRKRAQLNRYTIRIVNIKISGRITRILDRGGIKSLILSQLMLFF